MQRLLRRPLFCLPVLLFALLSGSVAAEAFAEPLPPLVVGVTWHERALVSGSGIDQIDRFETELAVAVARTQGREVVFQLGPLDWLLRELSQGRVDFMPGMARTKERQAIFDFSVPHNRLSMHLFVRRGETRVRGVNDLSGAKIIVITDSYSEGWITARGLGARRIAVGDLSEAVRRLSAGEADCLLAKQINMFAAIRAAKVDNIEVRGPPIPDSIQDVCIAVRRGNRDLLAGLNEGLFQLKQTGELDRMYEKWLGLLSPSGSSTQRFARLVRYVSISAALVVILAAIAWTAYRSQTRRANDRLAEIERRVAARTEELASAKSRFEAVVASMPAGIVLLDPHDPAVPGRIVECNDFTCRMHGYTKVELLGAPFNRLLVEPLSHDQYRSIVADLKTGQRRHGHSQHLCKNGSILEAEFYSTFVKLDGRELILSVDLDVSERLRAEAALRRTEEFQRLVLQATNDGIFDWDIVRDHFSMSGRGWQLLGFAENELPARRFGWWQRLHPDDVKDADGALRRHVVDHQPLTHTARYLHKDGTVRWLYCRADTLREVNGRPVRMIGSYTDITELKRIDQELQMTRRLRAIGELAGGIAHEFNNLLTPILVQTTLLAELDSPGGNVAAHAQPILEAARRAQALTRELLQFGRNSDQVPTPQSVATIVESTLGLVRSTMDRRIELGTHIDAHLPPIRLNGAVMGQIVMNLVLNAQDALLEKLGGEPPASWRPQLQVRLCAHTGLRRNGAAPQPANAPQTWQRLTIEDNGPGIRPDIRERIFEPFFTTKSAGQGSGLGLAMVWNSVEELGGWIDLTSTANEFTRFDLYLPATADPGVMPELAAMPTTVTPASGAHLQRRLLLIDDDEMVGRAISSLLGRLGHTVVWLRDGSELLPQLAAEAPFDAIFTDLNMPGLGGEELVQRAQAAGFRGKIVVLSGRITREVEQRLRAAGVSALVQKPFEFERLKLLLVDLWS